MKLHPEKCLTFSCYVRIFAFLFQTKYREKPDRLKFTSVVDSPDLVHAKNSYMHCNEVGVFLSLLPGSWHWVVSSVVSDEQYGLPIGWMCVENLLLVTCMISGQ